MSSRLTHIRGSALLITLAGVGPASALTAEPTDLPALERAWHSCVHEAYDSQQDRGSRAGRERNALDECKPHEDAYVASLMAARPDDPNMPVQGWARTWAAYVVDPITAWMEALRH
ncbi:hypothetical protein [Methylobacterium sp. GC_Met_2]|uniref:hypothetical protein n=1 Tax=Methylobacterium sp. GC_Met_2 TaxID=2937376 RepID=UPI00226B68C3|nr:hypothetical protein [Methylobacterium sp. GC_Met_2]